MWNVEKFEISAFCGSGLYSSTIIPDVQWSAVEFAAMLFACLMLLKSLKPGLTFDKKFGLSRRPYVGPVRMGCCSEPKACDVFWNAVYGRDFRNTSGVSPVFKAVNGFFTDLFITPTGSYWYGCRMLLKKLSTNDDLISVIGRGENGACVISVL